MQRWARAKIALNPPVKPTLSPRHARRQDGEELLLDQKLRGPAVRIAPTYWRLSPFDFQICEGFQREKRSRETAEEAARQTATKEQTRREPSS
jgi:hypothetical protein